jgi:hypothetical protein
MDDGEEKEDSGRRYFGTKVLLIVSGEHWCRTRTRFAYAEENRKVSQLPTRGRDHAPSSFKVSRTVERDRCLVCRRQY